MKKNDVYSMLLTENSDDADLLSDWLDERIATIHQDKIVLPGEILSARQDNARLAAAAGAYDGNVGSGQIRILAKRYTNNADKIPYVAVLEEREGDAWLVAPFSEYTYPATPGEMVTGMHHLGLRVLQAWNARVVPTRLLEKSFLFGKLDEHVCRNAAELCRHELSGQELPGNFDALTGPAVVCEADPRCDYMDECRARLSPLATAVRMASWFDQARRTKQDQLSTMFAKNRPVWGAPEHVAALAAGNLTEATDTFVIRKDELSVEYSPEDKKARLVVYDQDDRPNAAYDGYGLLGYTGEFLGVLHNGAITVPAETVKDGFQLIDPSGAVVTLEKKN